jgi:hypothetical protein
VAAAKAEGDPEWVMMEVEPATESWRTEISHRACITRFSL